MKKQIILSILMIGSVIFNQEPHDRYEINTIEKDSSSWFPFEVATSCPLYLKEDIEEALNSDIQLSQDELSEMLYDMLFFTDSMAIELILKLLSQNIDLNALYPNGNTYLNKAIDYSKGNLKVVKILLNAGANPNIEANCYTPLCLAIWNNDLELVKMLLDAGADPNYTDSQGDRPLHIAVLKNNLEISKVLIDAGANLN